MSQPLTVPPGTNIQLSEFDTRFISGDWTKKSAAKQIKKNTAVSRDLAYQLYAENRRAVLLVLQGMDTAGKDGTIRTVVTGINPQSCQITSFKQPSHLELDHDFLWRIHNAVPRRGEIGIFNRSHYEDVLVVRVHNLVPKEEWKTRYERINEFEQLLVERQGDYRQVLLAHQQGRNRRERLQARLDNPKKRWKFSTGDLAERKLVGRVSSVRTKMPSLFAIPSTPPGTSFPPTAKWYRNMLVSGILRRRWKNSILTYQRVTPAWMELSSNR